MDFKKTVINTGVVQCN